MLTTYPDGSTESSEYDANGNVTATTDRLGRTTRMEYDALNRKVATVFPDGSRSSTEFDAVGRVTAETDVLGHTARTEYDAGGRVSRSTDAAGHVSTFAYDANGNRTSVTLDGKTTSYEYDALNRLVKTTFPDGRFRRVEWRLDGLKGAETDENGQRTEYRYDGNGRLTDVVTSDPANP